MKIGILGFGSMGKTHLYSVRNIPFFFSGEHNFEVAYVCTSKIETAKAASEQYNIPFYTDNENDVIYNNQIDIIDICTPNIYHYETAKKQFLQVSIFIVKSHLQLHMSKQRSLQSWQNKRALYAELFLITVFFPLFLKQNLLLMRESLAGCFHLV